MLIGRGRQSWPGRIAAVLFLVLAGHLLLMATCPPPVAVARIIPAAAMLPTVGSLHGQPCVHPQPSLVPTPSAQVWGRPSPR